MTTSGEERGAYALNISDMQLIVYCTFGWKIINSQSSEQHTRF